MITVLDNGAEFIKLFEVKINPELCFLHRKTEHDIRLEGLTSQQPGQYPGIALAFMV